MKNMEDELDTSQYENWSAEEDANKTGEWLERQMGLENPQPKTAQELTEIRKVGKGGVDSLARRLDDLRAMASVKNIVQFDLVDLSEQKKIREAAIMFLSGYQANPNYEGFERRNGAKVEIEPLVSYAKNVIKDTFELENILPSKGLEEFFSRQTN